MIKNGTGRQAFGYNLPGSIPNCCWLPTLLVIDGMKVYKKNEGDHLNYVGKCAPTTFLF